MLTLLVFLPVYFCLSSSLYLHFLYIMYPTAAPQMQFRISDSIVNWKTHLFEVSAQVDCSMLIWLNSHHHCLITERFHHLGRKLHAASILSRFPTISPMQLLISICLQNCMFWTFHRLGIIHYVVFDVCLLSLSTVLSQVFINTAANIKNSLSFVAE